jgi:hypothetical protein
MQMRGDFPGFLKYFSSQSNIGEYRVNIPLELEERRQLFFKAEPGAVLSIFWHERCYFLYVWQGCLGPELCPNILVICTRKWDKSHENQ